MSTVFRVQKNANYTTMSNYHLKDKRLSYKAKGLLSVILSLPEGWDYSLKGLACISDDGVDGVRGGIRELEKFGYITRSVQTRNKRGQLSANEYLVYENPEQNPNFIAEKETSDENGITEPNLTALENPTRLSSDANENISTALENPTRSSEHRETVSTALDFPITGNPITAKPSTVNPTTGSLLNNKILTNQVLNNQSIHQSNEDRIDRTDYSQDKQDFSFSELKEKILENIEYDCFPENEKVRVSELVNLMVDVISARSGTIRVNGADMPKSAVEKRFLSLEHEHIDYVLDAMKRSAPDVRNIRAYLITALYNAPVTMDSYWSAMADRDIRTGKI